MALLAGTTYDPGTAVTKACSSLLAMTAIDTTNLRLTFTVPANGAVLVRLRGMLAGNGTHPEVLLGILESSTVVARQIPLRGRSATAVSAARVGIESTFVVSGLTPGASLTWDAAYGVEDVDTAACIKYGGPNNATTNDAWGGFEFSIWDTPTLLGSKLYDPSSAASAATSGLLAVTAFDTSNLRITFTAPASGQVFFRMQCINSGGTPTMSALAAILSGASIVARVPWYGGKSGIDSPLGASVAYWPYEASGVIAGLTPGNSYSFDAAYSCEGAQGSTAFRWGGPNNTTTVDAFGAFAYEIWAA